MIKGKASLQEFREWLVKKGRVGNPGKGNGSYPGQCVSAVQCYLYYVHNVEYASRGNAKDFVPPGFVRVSSYKPGDIIRYGSNYGGGYGHIGLIDDTGAFLDQNGAVVLTVHRQSKPFSGINAIFRPTKKFNVKTPKPAKPKYPRKVTVTIPKLNVRSKPTTSAPLAGSKTLNKGDVFTSVGLVKGQKVGTNDKWHKSTKGNYAWSGGTNVK